MTVILITGFGPFPGAPENPTGPLVRRLARTRRPELAGITIVPHVFETSYAAVDRDLPRLLRRHRPDALLMFGLAAKTPAIRVETLARNVLEALPDVTGVTSPHRWIAAGKASGVAIPAPAQHLLAAIRRARVPVTLSRDAGGYLCNYLCWQAAATVARSRRPRLAAFIHVPMIARGAPGESGILTLSDLNRAATNALIALATAARR